MGEEKVRVKMKRLGEERETKRKRIERRRSEDRGAQGLLNKIRWESLACLALSVWEERGLRRLPNFLLSSRMLQLQRARSISPLLSFP